MKIKNAKFIISAPTIKQAPPANVHPEMVVVGRSNVGKSSFICRLTGQKIAKVSSTPGKTRLINYFLINENWYLVDLPGYGFAKVSKAEQERWGHSMEEFLSQRQGIRLAILLVDCRHEVKDSDLQMYDWLQDNSIKTAVVLTKTDKIGKNKIPQAASAAAREFGVPASEIWAVSSETGDGFEQLVKYMDKCLA